MKTSRRTSIVLAFALLAISPAAAQEPPGGARPPLNREAMWPAPTAEDWKKPCLITWQRTWEDALAVARETNRAILVCINMDGEIASEHYAGVRYRMPEIAALYEPYVTVIASVYRHTPRDYDDAGNRILCPRFGSVTCGEHIAIEPIVYERYLDGVRIAPRHIMVELDGREVYDVYYRNDTASVFEDIRKGIAERTEQPKVIVRGDRPMVERVASRDIRDRIAVEAAYAAADKAQRQALLEAAAKEGAAAPIDLLRLALFGLDVDLARTARGALAQSQSPAATDLIVDALKVPLDDKEREALIAALARLGETSPKARWLASVEEGLTARGGPIDAGAWAKGGGTYEPPPAARDIAELEALRQGRENAQTESPQDAEACLKLAEASLALALKARQPDAGDPQIARAMARHMFEDARRGAEKAEALGATGWRVNTIIALADYYQGALREAYDRAEAAMKDLPPGESSWNTMAVLTIFAEGKYRAIKQAAREGRRWPGRWLADLDAAYSALLHHPLATEEQVTWHYDFLVWLAAKDRATRFLRACMERFPDSRLLHDRLRDRLLTDSGAPGLEAYYDGMLKEPAPAKNLRWFAGYASLVAAEVERRAGRFDNALAAYARSIAHFDGAAAADPEWKDSADHYAALALAGRARIAYERKDYEAAVTDIVACFARRSDTASARDGLSITPAATAKMLLSRLEEQKLDALASKLKEAMGRLDPELLKPREDE